MNPSGKRGNLATEQRNSRSAAIDQLSASEILHVINREDHGIAAAVKAAIPRIETFVENVIKSFNSGGRLIYLGAGTSGRLGVLDAAECPPTFSAPTGQVVGLIAGGSPALTTSMEGAEDRPEDGAKALLQIALTTRDCVLGIATGATTPYVHGGLQYARELGAYTGFLICTDEQIFKHLADVLIPVLVGPEIVTGSTRMKAGTATKLVLNMITTTAMIATNKTYGNWMVDLQATNAKLWDRGARIIAEITHLEYDAALEKLQAADGEVKVAITMIKCQLPIAEARQRLLAADGALRKVLEQK